LKLTLSNSPKSITNISDAMLEALDIPGMTIENNGEEVDLFVSVMSALENNGRRFKLIGFLRKLDPSIGRDLADRYFVLQT
jgi:hypothetical protein